MSIVSYMTIVLACSKFHGPLEKMHANILIRVEILCFSPTVFIAIHVLNFVTVALLYIV